MATITCPECDGAGGADDFATGIIIGGAAGLPYAPVSKPCPTCNGSGEVDEEE